MTKREVYKLALTHRRVPYVPWQIGFTQEAKQKLFAHYGVGDAVELDRLLDNHSVSLGSGDGRMTDIGDNRVRDQFGVVWDRSVDKDIGVVRGLVLPEPRLPDLRLPDPLDKANFSSIPERIEKYPDRFRVFAIGFSLYERAWTLRGMENLMMDFIENPGFVRDLLRTLADYNIAMIREALKYDIDAVHFGDDWGMQHGLQMGAGLWREFIKPELKRMYGEVKRAGKFVTIHSCGDVDEIFDDLVEIGLDCFNPFQPEVMDVPALFKRYKGRLAFHGGLSTQKTLPYGTVEDVRAETRRLLAMGKDGGYIFSPAHAVEGDVPAENMVAFIEELHHQPGSPISPSRS